MKVSELISALSKLDGDLEVYSWCDYPESPEKVSMPETIYVAETTKHLHEEFAFLESYAEDFGYTVKAVLL